MMHIIRFSFVILLRTDFDVFLINLDQGFIVHLVLFENLHRTLVFAIIKTRSINYFLPTLH